jgi:hypothetical protein
LSHTRGLSSKACIVTLVVPFDAAVAGIVASLPSRTATPLSPPVALDPPDPPVPFVDELSLVSR